MKTESAVKLTFFIFDLTHHLVGWAKRSVSKWMVWEWVGQKKIQSMSKSNEEVENKEGKTKKKHWKKSNKKRWRLSCCCCLCWTKYRTRTLLYIQM